MRITERLQHGWNAFMGRDPTEYNYKDMGASYSYRPDRKRFTGGNERSIVTSLYNRIAVDVAAITIEHAYVDEDGHYLSTINDGLNYCLTTEANIDQTARAFMQDVVMSMLDEGCVAIVPVDTTLDPSKSSSWDISTMRCGKIVQWYSRAVRIRLYNDRTGYKEEVTLPKSMVAIVENPFYSVMNEPNSTLQRLIRKLNILDSIDEQSGSNKLDLIVQLPYIAKTPARKKYAEDRRSDIEAQLSGSKYGIAYTDGTEKITQLNRPVENNLLSQIEYLTNLLYSQIGISQEVMNGTADEKTKMNYQNGTIEPILSAIVNEMIRTFLTKTARTRGQSIIYFIDPLKLIPVAQLATIADTLTRNEIFTGNEIRQRLGAKPSDDPSADELQNKNIKPPYDPNAQYEDPNAQYEDPNSDPYSTGAGQATY